MGSRSVSQSGAASKAALREGYQVINVTLTRIPNHCTPPPAVHNQIGLIEEFLYITEKHLEVGL
jgi:hypothetical protein